MLPLLGARRPGLPSPVGFSGASGQPRGTLALTVSKPASRKSSSLAKKDAIIKTKIVCTLGPASGMHMTGLTNAHLSSESPDTLEKMVDEGMDVARLNFSHGTHRYPHLLSLVD